MAQTLNNTAANSNKDRARYEQQFYKTRQCSFYAKGKCTRGQQCKYAHGETELQDRPDLTFTSLCREYATTGTCTNPKCSFAHNPGQLRATGKFFKTSLCKFHLQGRCRLGQECRHAHGEDELTPLPKTVKEPATPTLEQGASAALNRTFAASLLLNAAAAGTKLGPVYSPGSLDYSPWAEMDFRAFTGFEPAFVPQIEEPTLGPLGYLSAPLVLDAPPGLTGPGCGETLSSTKFSSGKSFSSFSTRTGLSSSSSSSSIEDEPLQVELPDWKLTI